MSPPAARRSSQDRSSENVLDGDIALQLGVARPVHLAHPALADGRKDFIGAESVADSERYMTDLA